MLKKVIEIKKKVSLLYTQTWLVHNLIWGYKVGNAVSNCVRRDFLLEFSVYGEGTLTQYVASLTCALN